MELCTLTGQLPHSHFCNRIAFIAEIMLHDKSVHSQSKLCDSLWADLEGALLCNSHDWSVLLVGL